MGQDCGAYPFTDGMNVEDVQGGIRIISTATSTVTFDDIDSVKDARDEAELEAKAAIARFMSEGIKSDSVIARAVQETKSMQGGAKAASRNEAISRVKRLASSSAALLRGVVVLGDCYTKGQFVRVSVGLKPETIAQAERLSGDISTSIGVQPAPGAPRPPTGRSPPLAAPPVQAPSGVGGHSNTERLNRF